VRGWAADAGEIDYDLRSEEHPAKSQSSQTRYTCVKRVELALPVSRYPTARFSLLKLIPLTGRKHQLRRHMAHLRHPIIGDTCHGDSAQNRFLRQHFGLQRLLLRATKLEIDMPNCSTRLQLQAPQACEFSQLVEALKLS
jgi:tRNA pseudouridine65 synthase